MAHCIDLSIILTNPSMKAAKAYEKHKEQNGQPSSHAAAKELLAGFAGAFIDREFETKGVSDSSSSIYGAVLMAYKSSTSSTGRRPSMMQRRGSKSRSPANTR